MSTAVTLVVLAAALPAPDFVRGRVMLDAYFRDQIQQVEAQTLSNLATKADWEKQRPELRRQFLDMMGLWPLPPRTDLKPVVTGTVETAQFTIEKVHFQSKPGLYVTANLYRPRAKPAGTNPKFPAILYVCGHGNVVEKGISFGSKVFYQYHPAWFASNGYVCLVLDTLELGEIPGEHHGTSRQGMWWWQNRGYTPGGVELWNAMRAIDYLESRPEVDASRIGVTGRSGGGATTWWVAAADDRPKAFAPVAGIADLRAHIVEAPADRFRNGMIAGHCDCMYYVNTHRWDFPVVVALAAPRPVLLGNSDADDIFPVAGYRRIAAKVRPVYDFYGASEKFQLLETQGPHRDTPELRRGINRWMNRWLKGDTTTPVSDDLPDKLTPQQLKVLERVPEGAVNEAVHEGFVKAATAELPESPAVAREWWTGRREQWMAALRNQVFAGWPKTPPPLTITPAGDVTHDGVRLRAFDFTSEKAIGLRLFVQTAAGVEAPTRVILSVLDEPGWETWCRDLGPEFAKLLQINKEISFDTARFTQNRAVMRAEKLAFAAICPRGIGPTKWAMPASRDDIQMRRRFALVGQTLDSQRVWDVRRAITVLMEKYPRSPIQLHGEREAAGIALYAGLFEPTVTKFDLWDLPRSHRNGPVFLNVERVLDLPHAVALAGPRPVTVHIKSAADRRDWSWPLQLQTATGGNWLAVDIAE